MSDWSFEEMMSEEFSDRMPSEDFRKRLAERSTQSLKAGYCNRVWRRRVGLAFSLMILVVTSFFGGRFSVRAPNTLTSGGLRDKTAQVSRDLIPWLRAGMLFTRVGLSDRANRAYRMANQLSLEYEEQEYGVFGLDQDNNSPDSEHDKVESFSKTRLQLSKTLEVIRSRREVLGKPILGTLN